jgi:hypothetical protein
MSVPWNYSSHLFALFMDRLRVKLGLLSHQGYGIHQREIQYLELKHVIILRKQLETYVHSTRQLMQNGGRLKVDPFNRCLFNDKVGEWVYYANI